ncbi:MULTISPECIES: DUF4437 domain-containing protein [unclassified Lentimicrobium]|uniref:DUF4437 domain-containing protein n=1 Tax=unclassified Lentimicrobium TaxID=2677434 RepID=UPI00155698A9|nr:MULTISPECIES: DUF4437 domain-containing protein [unclassified Lentimicrobium]NPD46941.1 DUF4437 domain-containing protein [Lentimicrobium sp. S6]NPD84144.1 DUF4437 domain-containing protein [Lentimicrobium sp. L6]
MKHFNILILAILLATFTQNYAQLPTGTKENNEVILASEVEWTYLNPARGDKAPMAGTLWGDRNGTEATGFLLKPSDGFKSPPHIHNVSYRGIVINGFIHNDDPNAENMWLPSGSFWTQPKGEIHITAAKGANTFAYIEIEEGPYLVHSTEDAFHTEETALNLDESNMVWLDASDMVWIEQKSSSSFDKPVQIAMLWGETKQEKLNGSLIKLPAGFKGEIQSESNNFRAVVIQGPIDYLEPGTSDLQILDAGSYFSSNGSSNHQLASPKDKESLIYVRSTGKYKVVLD